MCRFSINSLPSLSHTRPASQPTAAECYCRMPGTTGCLGLKNEQKIITFLLALENFPPHRANPNSCWTFDVVLYRRGNENITLMLQPGKAGGRGYCRRCAVSVGNRIRQYKRQTEKQTLFMLMCAQFACVSHPADQIKREKEQERDSERVYCRYGRKNPDTATNREIGEKSSSIVHVNP